MIDFNIREIFPRFLLEDRDGYAMAKALEAGLTYFLTVAEAGVKLLQDVDTMPEWRLDEMAWELNCLYDYRADIQTKRGWIRDAYKNYRIHGTPEGVRQYLNRFFGGSSIDEYWEFGGQPGQFNVTVAGTWSEENEKWIRKAVQKAKNVRSELLNIVYVGGDGDAAIAAVCAGVLSELYEVVGATSGGTTWRTLENYTWEQLEQYTWQEIEDGTAGL